VFAGVGESPIAKAQIGAHAGDYRGALLLTARQPSAGLQTTWIAYLAGAAYRDRARLAGLAVPPSWRSATTLRRAASF
jgi:hypothetical protein